MTWIPATGGNFGRIPHMRIARVALVAGLLACAPSLLQAQKVYIAVDMEGIAGLVNSSQWGSSGRDYGLGRALMEAETNAAIEGAFRAGASEVHVIDSHGGKTNLRPDRLDRRAVLITGGPRPLGMIHGIDSTYSAVAFVGFHARASTTDAVADHTYTGAIKSIAFNGTELGEAGLAGTVAGHYGVPVVFLSGDSAAVAEAEQVFPGVVGVSVKEAIGSSAAWAMHPEEAQTEIGAGVERAVRAARQIAPIRISAPVTIDIEVGTSGGADQLVFIPGMERTGARTVRYVAPDVPTAYRLSRLVRLLAAG